MTTATREILRGLAGGVGFLVAWLPLDMPWWLAGVLGMGIYAGMSFLLPAPPAPPDPVSVAPGVTAQERDQFVAQCGACAIALEQMAGQMAEGEFRARVENLARITTRLKEYFQRKPECMLAALNLPLNLDHLLKMLRQYLELSRSQVVSPGATVAEALQKVEDIVGHAALAFEGMYQQLLDNDVAALQASATSLEYLLGGPPALERVRRRRQTESQPDLKKSPAGPAASRPQQMEKPQ